eukprot:TRINITY_DN3334_c0_g1_i1.p1 TRINITY_DN3334_c0_g1~~TRINITY_DN3334_c0_g1_i1.p1  ORF type:complete len:189 (-),score=54.80 TRINITY_DN3334_c0_g1_i1:89-655(-)
MMEEQAPPIMYDTRPSNFSSRMRETMNRADMNRLATLKAAWVVLQVITLPLLISFFVAAGQYPHHTPGELRFTVLFAAFNFAAFGAVTFFPLFTFVVLDGVLYGVMLASSVWINMFALFEAISFGGSAKYSTYEPKSFTSIAVFASFYYVVSLFFVGVLVTSKKHLIVGRDLAPSAPEQPFNASEDSA